MIASEGVYTTLTWSQLLIGLIIGLPAVFVISAVERMRRKQQTRKGRGPDLHGSS